MYYLWVVPTCVIFFIGLSFMYVLNNEKKTVMIFVIYSIFRAIPILPIVSRISKRPLFDAMLYDIMMFIVCAVAIGIMSHKGFSIMSTKNVIGFFMVCGGFVLMQIK